MSQIIPVWLVLALAVLGSNVPFFSERFLGIFKFRARIKTPLVRGAELLSLYFAVGAFGLLLEKNAGQISPQGWEFYAVTFALFITLSFPGFVWRYLLRRR